MTDLMHKAEIQEMVRAAYRALDPPAGAGSVYVAAGAGSIRDLRQLVPPDVDVGGYLRLDRHWSEDGTTDSCLREYIDAGLESS